ncbi:MAG: DUF3445 domain-containing protein [Pseudomonadota bacterium]
MSAPWLLDHAPYTPFTDPRMVSPPGLSPLEPADWFRIDPDFTAQMSEREALITELPELVLAADPGAQNVRALYDRILDHLRAGGLYDFEEKAARRPDGAIVPLDETNPLATLGRLIAEDLCLMEQPGTGGEYRLVAATLCFPSRWLLSEKLGRPLTVIHEPVPDYDDTLARRVNRMFEAVRPGRPLVRVNWLVHAVAELHLPLGSAEKAKEPDDLSGPLYLRTERQTMTRIAPGSVVFAIKTSICPLEALSPAEAAALGQALSQLDPHSIAYRAGSDLHCKALSRLETLAA